MPDKEFDPHDPFDLVGTAIPMDSEDGVDTVDEMARTVIQEYLMMGWNDKIILGIFANETFRGPHTAYQIKGKEYLGDLILEERELHRLKLQRLFGNSDRKEN
jgi:hypothetical protein